MKKTFIILGSFLALLITTIVLIPVIFKDDIQRAIDETLDESLNAKVYYDIDQLNISLIKNFPNITVSMGDFGIAGIGDFEGDTLASIGSFDISVDVMSVISGNQIKVNKISLNEPKISVLVLENGLANYDIAKESDDLIEEDASEEESTSSKLSIGIEKWEVINGQVHYLDQSLKFYLLLNGLDHTGTGDFTLEIFDLNSKTFVDEVSLGYDGVEYVTNKKLDATVNLNMDLGKMKFTFLDNTIAVNNFKMEAEGFVEMPDDDIVMDISFGGKEISLKSILSLIPGAYQEYLDGVTATGEIEFDGFVRGTYNESNMPHIAANLNVKDGTIRYADYNIPMEEITINSSFDYPSADLSATSFSINNFHMLLDGEELSAYLKFNDLEDYRWDFGFEGNADLEKITRIFPVEGTELKGKINATLHSKGKMSLLEAEEYEKLPTSGSMNIKSFYFSSADVPQPLEINDANITFDPSTIKLNAFYAKTGSSDFNMNGAIENYLAFILGENEILSGKLTLTSRLIDVDELMPEGTEEVEEIEQTEDTISLEVVRIPENINFTFASELEKISYNNLDINKFKGNLFVQNGAIILDKTTFELLDGDFGLFGAYTTKDLNQPEYKFEFSIEDLSINRAYASFQTIQKYAPIAGKVEGLFSSELGVKGVLGPDMMPIMDKLFLQGLINVHEATLEQGDFVQKLSSATSIANISSGTSGETINLKDVLIKTKIENGRLSVEPFDLNVGGQTATFSGSSGLDGSLDYEMLIQDVPTGAAGNALNSAIGSYFGGADLIPEHIDLNFGIGGTYDEPSVSLLSSSKATGSNESSSGVTSAAKKQAEEALEEQRKKAEAELEKQKKAAEEALKKREDEAKKKLDEEKRKAEEEARKKAEEEAKKAEEELKNQVKGLFKKKGGGY